mmetsp:Transcript_34160/g.83168  ORF Transcript_34160/g.83168 Transcript_34160/m.83168 type:complete len:215 (+) Transcript_34160:967-1611(+)
MSLSRSDMDRPREEAAFDRTTAPSCFQSPLRHTLVSCPARERGTRVSGSRACAASSTAISVKCPLSTPCAARRDAPAHVATMARKAASSARGGTWKRPHWASMRVKGSSFALTSSGFRCMALRRNIHSFGLMPPSLPGSLFRTSSANSTTLSATTSAEESEGAQTSTLCPDSTARNTASATVLVLPVPGGPKMTKGCCGGREALRRRSTARTCS